MKLTNSIEHYGVGNPKIIGFGMNKASTLELAGQLITTGQMGVQTGGGVNTLTDSTAILYPDIFSSSNCQYIRI